MAKEMIRGVMPSVFDECIIHKTVPKTQKSFRLTSALLKKLCTSAEKVNKKGKIIILLWDDGYAYEVVANVIRNKGE